MGKRQQRQRADLKARAERMEKRVAEMRAIEEDYEGHVASLGLSPEEARVAQENREGFLKAVRAERVDLERQAALARQVAARVVRKRQ